MDEFEAIRKRGIPAAAGGIARDEEEAVAMAEKIGYPVALKIQSRDIAHKTEAKGIRLNLNSADEVRNAFKEIIANARAFKKGARIEGVWVQRFYEDGVEVIVGLLRDEVFGHAMMFGLGGIFTEVLADVAYRIAPIDEGEASGMIKEIKGYAVLAGARGKRPKDLKALARAISAFSRLGESLSVKEAEINPLLVFEKGVVAVDVRIVEG